ncbi:MAG: IS3 family transposase, partial [Gammaproteobacteria bacterium]|nr:IS3 family transposase [Gammaproteobacteria bacterium]
MPANSPLQQDPRQCYSNNNKKPRPTRITRCRWPPHRLEQDFNADAPNQKWVSDITYVWTDEGWLYLAVVLDLYSRLVVGYALSHRIDRALVIAALRRALFRRKFPREVIVHSDRGSQYCSADCQVLLTKHGLVCSMRKRGDCYDNAAMESGNHSYKVDT